MHQLKALAAFGFLAVMIALVLAANPAYASTTFTVDSARDEGDAILRDGVCDSDPRSAVVQCSLRAAIEEANATDGADTINFDIPGSGVRTIAPSSQLPTITDTVRINGYSQPGARPNTLEVGTNAVLKIELDGTNASDAAGLVIEAPTTVVKGLAINRFPHWGIYINTGGTGSAIQGNFIGTDTGGTLNLGNGLSGVLVQGSVTDPDNTTIGGTTPAARNLISGNYLDGITINFGTGHRVMGNLVGTDKNGTADLGNARWGVVIGQYNNSVGGTDPGAANVIAFNMKGVVVPVGDGNSILRNSIFSNYEEGIDLGVDGRTENDPGDADTGPNDVPDTGANNLQNFPVITAAATSSTATTIRGTLDSTPNTTFTVQFFRNPAGTDQGKKFIGQKKNVTTDASGDATFTFRPDRRVSAGLNITATATDPEGNTSEFSDPKTVT
jgi:CSLREA domain-containing protein